jgi:hypothetical protein
VPVRQGVEGASIPPEKTRQRPPQGKRSFVEKIDIIVVVRRYNKINKNSFNQLFIERDDLGGLATIKHTEIVNIIGRIRMNEFGKEILYLVLNRTETRLGNRVG